MSDALTPPPAGTTPPAAAGPLQPPAAGAKIELPDWVATHVGLRELQHAHELAAYRSRVAALEQLVTQLQGRGDAH